MRQERQTRTAVNHEWEGCGSDRSSREEASDLLLGTRGKPLREREQGSQLISSMARLIMEEETSARASCFAVVPPSVFVCALSLRRRPGAGRGGAGGGGGQ